MRRFKVNRLCSLIWWFVGSVWGAGDLKAQDSVRFEQFWLAGELRHSLNVSLMLKTVIEYQSVYDEGERWRGGSFTQDMVYSVFPVADVIVALRVFYTHLNDTLSRTELRPAVGVEIDILRRGRFVITNYLRFEWRQFFFNFSELNSSGSRMRNRVNVTVALNKRQPSFDKALSLKLSVEYFFIRDRELRERFDNRHRFEGGIEYRFNTNWRLKMSYYRQYSRNQIEQSFETRENILQLKCTYTLLKK